MHWNGKLPERRYAIFATVLRGPHMIVITGQDLETAATWGGFVAWVGNNHSAETKSVKKEN